MALSTSAIAGQTAYRWGAASLFASLGTIILALGFEHIGGYRPCELCLQQRYAYYLAIPALFVGLIFLGMEKYTSAVAVFFLIALAFLANAGLGTYQAGIEWEFWSGPATCASGTLQPLPTNGSDLLQSMKITDGPSCGVATWRFVGLSFAGWNAVLSIALTIGSLKAAFAGAEMRAVRGNS